MNSNSSSALPTFPMLILSKLTLSQRLTLQTRRRVLHSIRGLQITSLRNSSESLPSKAIFSSKLQGGRCSHNVQLTNLYILIVRVYETSHYHIFVDFDVVRTV